MNKSYIGSVSVAQVLAALARDGKNVLVPFGDYSRYDLALDDDGLKKIQVKTGRLDDGVVIFLTSSKATNKLHGNRWQSYEGIDYFGVYCPQNGKCYLVPFSLAGKGTCSLRLVPTKGTREYNVRWADDFEIGVDL